MDPFRFEDNFANVCFTALTARGIPHGNTRANVEVAQERVDVVPSRFERASGQMAISNSGVWFHNHYSGEIAFGVITQVGGNNAANHGAWVSNVRAIMDRSTQSFTANNLPCYSVLQIAEIPADTEQVQKSDAHRTELIYRIEVGILGTYVA